MQQNADILAQCVIFCSRLKINSMKKLGYYNAAVKIKGVLLGIVTSLGNSDEEDK
jgi:hypothetical protein